MRAVCQKHQLYGCAVANQDANLPVALECLAIDANAIPVEFYQAEFLPGSCTLPRMSQQDWAAEQANDPVISRVTHLLNTGKCLSYRVRQQENREVQLMLCLIHQLVVINGVLYRKRMNRGEPFYHRSIRKLP